ncbi:MAG: N-6 DNA methylase [Candidatus Omnitrophica bacterium]|nr:N-6 DNA methylase [Candidatus Omnitrophota bacterium]
MVEVLADIRFSKIDRKINGIHYTPNNLSRFVAKKMLDECNKLNKKRIKIFDPAVGDGALLESLSEQLLVRGYNDFEIYGFDTNSCAINTSIKRLVSSFNNHILLSRQDFLDYVLDKYGITINLFNNESEIHKFDLIISNPPYVRTQQLGAVKAQKISRNFGLRGRVDLYHAFIVGISRVLKEGGIAGIIVSNRFLTTKGGATLRNKILEEFDVIHVWDMGDTKIFNAAVLPAVLFLRKKSKSILDNIKPRFSSIYELQVQSPIRKRCKTLVEALEFKGVVELENNQKYLVRHGVLDVEECRKHEGVWRLSDDLSKKWISIIEENTHCRFGDIGKIRVGVKTTADAVFIRSDWEDVCKKKLPELLKKLTTHHIARRYRPFNHNKTCILYTHENVAGVRKVVDIKKYPNAFKYLLKFKSRLSGRKYVIDAGRKWFEIWVPHNPEMWNRPKVIFRDIVEEPTFWMDFKKTVVNGDCYWFTNEKYDSENILWLAMAVANSTFIEFYYDQMFNNKLYSNRRRFMTQYVEKFPVPNPNASNSRKIVFLAQKAFSHDNCDEIEKISEKIDKLVWSAFNLSRKEVVR